MVIEAGHLEPLTSALVELVAAAAILSLLLPHGVLLAIHWRRARPRPDTWHGIARVAEGDPAEPVAKVTSEQVGHKVWLLLGQGTEWLETERRFHARPFLLETPDGERLRIEPGADVAVDAPLVAAEPVDTSRRLRFGMIRDGEQVFIRGRREDAQVRGEGVFREATIPATLRPLPRARMLVSSRPPGARHAGLARFHLGAVLLGMVLLAAQLWVSTAYVRLVVSGDVVHAAVHEVGCSLYDDLCLVDARVGDETVQGLAAREALVAAGFSERTTSLPFVHVKGASIHALGAAPTAPWWVTIPAVFATLIALVVGVLCRAAHASRLTEIS